MAVERVDRELVLKALEALYAPPSTPEVEAQRKVAGDWLESASQTVEIWTIADELLRSQSNSGVLAFAARWLNEKIRYDILELDTAGRAGLRESLLVHLRTHAVREKEAARFLCLALVHLAVYMPEWTDVLSDVLVALPEPAYQRALLHFMDFFPDTTTRHDLKRKPSGRTRVLMEHAKQNAPRVFQFMSSVYATGDTRLQESVFRCASSWVAARYVDGPFVAQTGLIEQALQVFQSEERLLELGAGAREFLIEVLEKYNTNEDVKTIVLSSAGSLTQAYTALESTDDEGARMVAAVLISLGEAYMDMLVTSDPAALPQSHEFCGIILRISHHTNTKIALKSFLFWMLLAATLQQQLDAPDCDPQLAMHYIKFYDSLVSVVIRLAEYPLECGPEILTDEDFVEIRKEVQTVAVDDLVSFYFTLNQRDAALTDPKGGFKGTLITGRASLMVIERLLQAVDTRNWRSIEACLSCMRIPCENVSETVVVSSEQGQNEAMKRLIDFVAAVPSQVQHVAVLRAAVRVVGYAQAWFKVYPADVKKLFPLLEMALVHEATGYDAARTLHRLCKVAGGVMAMPGGTRILYGAITDARHAADNESYCHLLNACATVIMHRRPEEHQQSIIDLLAPTLTDLSTGLETGAVRGTPFDGKQCCQLLFRLAEFYKRLQVYRAKAWDEPNGTHPAKTVLESHVWPLLEAVARSFHADPTVMERYSTVIKCIIRTLGNHIADIVPNLCGLCEQFYKANPMHSGFLFVLCVLFEIHGPQRLHTDILMATFTETANTAFAFLAAEGRASFSNHQQIVDDFFLLAKRVLTTFPYEFLDSAGFGSIVEVSVVGLPLTYGVANESMRMFLDLLADMSSDEIMDDPVYRNEMLKGDFTAAQIVAIKQLATTRMATHAEAIVKTLLASALEDSVKLADEYVFTLRRFMQALGRDHVFRWFAEYFQTVPDIALPQRYKDSVVKCQQIQGRADFIDEFKWSIYTAVENVDRRKLPNAS